MRTLLSILLMASALYGQGITWTATLKAIRVVETGGLPNEGRGAKGDNGNAYGPYQIWKNYWIDSRVQGSHKQCLTDKAYSERVVGRYMHRYSRAAYMRLVAGKGTVADVERVARIHNGGPKGHKKKATLKYWAKVKRHLP